MDFSICGGVLETVFVANDRYYSEDNRSMMNFAGIYSRVHLNAWLELWNSSRESGNIEPEWPMFQDSIAEDRTPCRAVTVRLLVRVMVAILKPDGGHPQ